MNRQRKTIFIFAATVLLLLLHHSVVAQESPLYNPTLLDPNANYRQNVCDRHQKVYSGQVELRKALQGMELHPLLDMYDAQIFVLEDEKIKEEDPGVLVDLLDELGRRAGFTWRNSFGAVNLVNGLGDNATWTDVLVWGVNAFDLHADWWIPNVDRLKLGIGFPEGFYDASFILVGSKDESSDNINLFNWLGPFETRVWWAILATIVASAIFYIILERVNSDGEDVLSFSQGLFKSSLLFTQHFLFAPKSIAARLFSTSLAFWSVIIITTYTANLASLFVMQNKPTTIINSIDDAIRANMRICIWKDTGSADYVIQKFPKGIFVEKASEDETIFGVKDGDCDFALTSITSWEQIENNREMNGDCDLAWTGRVVKSVDAGFGVKNDAGVLCTSLIYDVLNIHLMEMNADGFIEKAWEDAKKSNENSNCDGRVVSNNDGGDSVKLEFDDMAGTFFLHFLAAIFALFVTVISTQTSKRRTARPPTPMEDDDTNDVSSIPTARDKEKEHTAEDTKLLLDIQEEIRALRNQHSEHSKQTARLVSILEVTIQDEITTRDALADDSSSSSIPVSSLQEHEIS